MPRTFAYRFFALRFSECLSGCFSGSPSCRAFPALAFALSLLFSPLVQGSQWLKVPARDTAHIRYTGRVVFNSQDQAVFTWSGTSATLSFEGRACRASFPSTGGLYHVFLNGIKQKTDPAWRGDTAVWSLTDLPAGRNEITLYKRTEASLGSGNFIGFEVLGKPLPPGPRPSRRLEFIGNSITCGYGVLDSIKENPFSPETQDHHATYAAIAARRLGAEAHTLCRSGIGLMRNFDGTTEVTMPSLWASARPAAPKATGKSAWKPDAVILALGTNDFFKTPPPDSARFVNAWIAFAQTIRARYPGVALVLVDGPMLGDGFPCYDEKPRRCVPSLTLIRSFNQSAASRLAAMNQGHVSALSFTPNSPGRGYGADWHPNQAQQALNADELSLHLKKALKW